MLDEEESVINQNSKKIETGALKEKIEQTTEQIIAAGNEMINLLKQNEQIRLENQELRRQIESRLVEQAA